MDLNGKYKNKEPTTIQASSLASSLSLDSVNSDVEGTPGFKQNDGPLTTRNVDLQGALDSSRIPNNADRRTLIDRRVVLNVGGQKFVTFQSTLQTVPNSRLAKLDHTDPHYVSRLGEYFFDRSPRLFEPIMDFYRTGELHMPQCMCGPTIKKELDFWGIDDTSVSVCCWKAYKRHELEQKTLKALEKVLADEETDDEEGPHLPERSEQAACKRPEWIKKLWRFIDKPSSSKAAQVWATVIFLLIIVSIAAVCLQTHPTFRVARPDLRNGSTVNGVNITNPKELIFKATKPHPVLQYLDYVCVSVFTVELLLRFFSCPCRIRFFLSVFNIIDLFCVLPRLIVVCLEKLDPGLWDNRDTFVIIIYLSLTSVLRVFRLFKLARHYKNLKLLQLAIKSSFKEMLLLCMLIIMGMLVFATLIYFAEFEREEAFPNIPIGFWWSIVTMTTVGYGDTVPQTGWGYLVGSLCAICGMLATGLPIPIIASNFNHYHEYARFLTQLTQRHQLTKERENTLSSQRLTPKTKGVPAFMKNRLWKNRVVALTTT